MEEAIPETEIIEHYPYQEQEQHQAQYQFQEQTQPESVPESKTEPEHEPEPIIMPGPETEPEPEIPARKRRIHWIIPVAASVIIILSLVFYFRNFHTSRPSAVSSQQKEVDSRQLTVDSSRQSSVVSQQSSVVSQQSAVSRQQSEVSSQQAIEPTHNSELITPNSELSTKNSALISPGAHLFQLAREIYGNPYLWVLIYKENLDKIPDPDMVISGSELVIPNLEGKPDRLTRNDSVAVSEGYRLVYEYFKTKDDPRTKDFFRAMKRYTPK
jgi:nucleoid-associated protein YgaU